MDARWQNGNEGHALATGFLDRVHPDALAVQYGVRSDDDLARMVRAGDHRAFAELVGRYRERVYALALDCTGSEEQAGDVVCETFVTAFRAAGSGARGTPRRWFYVHTLRAVFARRAEGRHPSRQRSEP
jgi:RNA polymerase sigma-70 factor (ECF subfamily)